MSKLDEIRKLTKTINEKHTKGNKKLPIAVIAGDDPESLKPTFIQVNVPQINSLLGGGFARKSMHLIGGDEGVGKTAMCLSAIAIEQEKDPDCVALWINTEGHFPYETATKVGVDLERLIVLEPQDFGEELIDTVTQYLYDSKNSQSRGLISITVVDSINNMVPKRATDREEKKGAAAPGMGDRALMITKFVENLLGRGMLRSGTTFFAIVQYRANTTGYGPPKQLSCGKALQYNAKTITLLDKKVVKEKVGEIYTPVRQEVRVTIEKNNISGSPTAGSYIYDYQTGLDDSLALFNSGMELGIISKKGRSGYCFAIPGMEEVNVELKKAEIPAYLKNEEELLKGLREYVLHNSVEESEPSSFDIETEIKDND